MKIEQGTSNLKSKKMLFNEQKIKILMKIVQYLRVMNDEPKNCLKERTLWCFEITLILV